MENNIPIEDNMAIDVLEDAVGGIIEEWIFNGPFQDEGEILSDSDSEPSDDDDEPQRQRRACVKNYVENTVRSYSDVEFKRHFRLTHRCAYNLIERFQQTAFLMNNEPQENAVTHERALLLTLWYLANTETFRQIADRFDLSRSSAHKILSNTLDFLISLCDEYIRWPTEENEKIAISREFSRHRNIHGVLGAIDGCHMRIRKPIEHEQDYFNRKKYHSVVLQGVVTSRKIFTDIYIGEPGSMHDARILRKSPIYERALEEPEFFGDYFLLGDSAYPNLPWLVPPFRDNGHLTIRQRSFNFRHASTRVKVEQAFGLLRAKFRRLIRLDNLRLDIIVHCIMAACILHNICILENDEERSDESNGENDDENINNINCSDHENVDNEIDDVIVGVEDRRQRLVNQMFIVNNAGQ